MMKNGITIVPRMTQQQVIPLSDCLLRTGRTTRMLKEAKRLAGQGRAVYVIAANEQHRKDLQTMLPPNTPIKVETAASCGNFDWKTMRLRGAHPSCAILVDHWAIECTFADLLRELHRYDETQKDGDA